MESIAPTLVVKTPCSTPQTPPRNPGRPREKMLRAASSLAPHESNSQPSQNLGEFSIFHWLSYAFFLLFFFLHFLALDQNQSQWIHLFELMIRNLAGYIEVCAFVSLDLRCMWGMRRAWKLPALA